MRETRQNDEFLRKRKERQKKIRKRRLKIFFTFFVIILLITGVILSLTVLFPIKTITAKGSKIYSKAEIVSSSGIKTGDNLFTVSAKETLEKLKNRLPFVEKIEFKRTIPDTLTITVTDAKEYACYSSGGKYYTVSKSGWILASYDELPQNIILIITDKVKCKVGTAIEFTDESSHSQAQDIIDRLSDKGITAQYVDLTDSLSLKAKVDGRFIVNFGTSADLEYKIKHLASMVEEIDENKTGKINLSMWNSQNTQGTFVQTDIK